MPQISMNSSHAGFEVQRARSVSRAHPRSRQRGTAALGAALILRPGGVARELVTASEQPGSWRWNARSR
eukprot:843804-Pyramimonas_sp.AAC.1